MRFFAALGIITATIIVIVAIVNSIRKKYTSFVIDNSISLKRLSEINKKYTFYKCENGLETHTYDNKAYYDMISCRDYLIYQLQSKKESILRDIKNISENYSNYLLYYDEVLNINSFGTYDLPTKGYNLKYLNSIEKELFDNKKLYPTTLYQLKVILKCSYMNGHVYDSKSQIFDADQIKYLINKLEDKSGYFYNDRMIWDALCHVERGKVSNSMRFQIYNRDGYRCRICGKYGVHNDLEIDHIKPIAKGGKSVYENLQTLCKSCNKEKGDKYWYKLFNLNT